MLPSGTVIFVNVDGQKKIIRGHETELEFDNEVANTGLSSIRLPVCILKSLKSVVNVFLFLLVAPIALGLSNEKVLFNASTFLI